jgi:hypothetical protein
MFPDPCYVSLPRKLGFRHRACVPPEGRGDLGIAHEREHARHKLVNVPGLAQHRSLLIYRGTALGEVRRAQRR